MAYRNAWQLVGKLGMVVCSLSTILLAQAAMPTLGPATSLRSAGALVRLQDKDSHSSKISGVSEDISALKLGPGFLINLQVIDGDDLNGVYRLDATGNVRLPFIGALALRGTTAAEAEALIAERLQQAALFVHPQVLVTIVEYTEPSVTIVGEVNAPGKYPLLVEHPLVEVLALAGGLTPLAGNKIEVERPQAGGTQTFLIDYARDSSLATVAPIKIHPGDMLHVRRAGLVYVLGAVNRPGAYPMQEDGQLDVVQVLALASGTALQAYTGGVRVIRRNAQGELIQIPFSYAKAMRAQEESPKLRAGDVVYVPPSKLKSVLLDSQTILSSATAAGIYSATR